MPATGKDRKSKRLNVYWDTSVILAWIKDETRGVGQMENLYTVAEEIHNNRISMFTCVTTYGEIFDSSLTDEQRAKLLAVFDRTNTDVVNIDKPVGRTLAEVRRFYKDLSKVDGRPELGYADAEHLAAALHFKADEFHTFDQHDKIKPPERGLLTLGNSVAGRPLRVCMPKTEQIGLL